MPVWIRNKHLHFTTGKSQMDDTYARNRTQEKGNLYAKDKIIFEEKESERVKDAQKLLNAIKR